MSPPEDKKYLYRYDQLNCLLSQRVSDPTLRGRRSDGKELYFPHHQVRSAHSECAPGQAVYRLSFWRTMNDLKRHFIFHPESWVVQRVSEDHHCLKGFRRGEDEYLPDCAWLYWKIQSINPGNPDWSPVGVPHADIEVLHPDGQWLNMEHIPVLTHHKKQNWKSVECGMSFERYPVYWAVKKRSNSEQVVLIRQPYRVGRCHIECNNEHAKIILHILRDCAFSSRDIPRTRWFYAYESAYNIISEELHPLIRKGLKGYFNKLITQWSTNNLHCDWNVSLPKSGSFCNDSQTDELYQEFNLSGVLLRGGRWTYVDSPCALQPT